METDKDASPSQRRVDALLRSEARVGGAASGAAAISARRPSSAAGFTAERGKGRKGTTIRNKTSVTAAKSADGVLGGTSSFKKETSPGKRAEARSGFLNFGSFWRRSEREKPPSPTASEREAARAKIGLAKRPPPPRLTLVESSALFARLHADPSKSIGAPDPEETFAPKISNRSREMAALVHAREAALVSEGYAGPAAAEPLSRVDVLVRRGAERMRERKRRVEAALRDTRSAMDRADKALRLDPREYHLDASGRVGIVGDPAARAMRVAEDDAIAATQPFKPEVSRASREIARRSGRSAGAGGGDGGGERFYRRGVEWLRRASREREARRAAAEAERVRECTFRPKTAGDAPAYTRAIAAKSRRRRELEKASGDASSAKTFSASLGAYVDGVSGALASAASRSAGWLAPVGAFGRWSKTLRESGGAYGTASSGPVALVDPRWTDQNGGDGSYVAAGDVVLPSPPADHPARRNRRPSAHAPIRGAASHYARKDDTVRLAADELGDRRLAERALAELELAEDENDENVDENEDGDDARGNDANAPKGGGGGKDGARRAGGVAARGFERRLRAARSSSPSSKGGGGGADYFERVHMERAQRARALEAEKLARLNRHDGSRWTNRSTAPRAPKLGSANPRNASARERRQKSRAAEANRFAVLDRNMTDLDARFSISNRTRAGDPAYDERGGKGGRRGSGFGAFFGASGARGYFAALARGGAGAPGGGGLSSGDDSDRGGDETDLADDFASAGEDLDQEEAERAEETTGRAGGDRSRRRRGNDGAARSDEDDDDDSDESSRARVNAAEELYRERRRLRDEFEAQRRAEEQEDAYY